MKKTIKSFLVAAAALFAFTACTEEPALDDLGGKYPAPDNYTMNNLLFEERVQGESVHNFNLIVATEGLTLEGETYSGNGAALSLKLLDNKSTLTTQSYTAATADKAKKGNYIIGEGGSQILVVENGTVTPKNIVSGEVIVTIFQEQYNLYGTLWLADESIAKFDATIDLPNHGDLLVKTKLTQVFAAQSNLANGQNTISLSLGTAGISSEIDMTTYQTIWKGEGFYFKTDLYSADGYLHEGVYKAGSAVGVVNEGEFGIGYDNEAFGAWGLNWGTCWIAVPDGTTTSTKISEGEIVVTKKNGKYTISYLYGDIWCEFTGAIADVDPDAGSGDSGNTDTDTTEYVELTELTSAQSNVANGTPSLTIKMSDGNWSVTYDPTTYQPTYTGAGNYLAMDIYSADGKLYTGTYVANTVGGVLAEGQFGIGYDTTMEWFGQVYEMFNWGTCWWTVDADAETIETAEKVLAGEVDVLVMGENLVIKLRSEVVNAKFTCPVADFKDGAGNAIEVVNLGGNDEPAEPGDADTTEYEELTRLDYAAVNKDFTTQAPTSVSLNMANESWTVSYDTGAPVYTGEGNYLSTDIYTADGKLHTGTYVANTEGGVLAEGQFGIGYDKPEWNGYNWGTCWWAVADGAATPEKVLDGEMDILVEGENLVIKLRSTLVNAKFTYPVANLKETFTGTAIEVVAE